MKPDFHVGYTEQLFKSFLVKFKMKMFILPLLILLVIKVSGKCDISPLSTEYNITSDTIVSGTVKSFYMKKSGGPFAGKVKVSHEL